MKEGAYEAQVRYTQAGLHTCASGGKIVVGGRTPTTAKKNTNNGEELVEAIEKAEKEMEE